MSNRFSAQELHHLRNDLPIKALIKALRMPCKHRQGETFRFECPQCLSYHTAVHPGMNLARCFDCRRNFNSIELVMLVRQLPFAASVKFLQKHEGKLTAIKPTLNHSAKPNLIGEILQQMALAKRGS